MSPKERKIHEPKDPTPEAGNTAEAPKEALGSIVKQKLKTKIKLGLIKHPKFQKHFELLEQEGVVDNLINAVYTEPYDHRKYFGMTHSRNGIARGVKTGKEYNLSIIKKVLPANFLQTINKRLKVLNKAEVAKTPKDSNYSMYHLTSDKRLLDIVKNGFRSIDDHDHGVVSTGRFERALGLNGIFFSYAEQLQGYEQEAGTNVVVYPNELLYEDDSINISGECSYGARFEQQESDWDTFTRIFDENGMEYVNPKKMTNEDHVIDMLGGIISAMNGIENPDNMDHDEFIGQDDSMWETCVNPRKLKLPQMIIVEEDPEYFYDEAAAAGSDFIKVPMISDDKVKEALKKKGIIYKESTMRSTFVNHCNKGEINPWDWAMNKPTS